MSIKDINNAITILKNKLWKEYFWSQSFCLLTTSGAPINILNKYIESQGIKNGKKS